MGLTEMMHPREHPSVMVWTVCRFGCSKYPAAFSATSTARPRTRPGLCVVQPLHHDVKSVRTRFQLEVPHEQEDRKMRGTVQKVIEPAVPGEPEKAQINMEEADDLYREIRVENVVSDEKGDKASLKEGAEVDVIIEADSDAATKKSEKS